MSDGRSPWRWVSGMHLLPGRGQPPQTNLLLKTDTRLARIHLGPTAFLGERNIEIRKGDTVQVTASSVATGDSHTVSAREVRRGAEAWTFRNAVGQPLWDPALLKPRKWTARRIAITAIAMGAMPTLLRH